MGGRLSLCSKFPTLAAYEQARRALRGGIKPRAYGARVQILSRCAKGKENALRKECVFLCE